jgi:DNA replication and repair protein RecF
LTNDYQEAFPVQFQKPFRKKFEFSPQINCFVGNNGVEKPIFWMRFIILSVGKSFLGNTDLNNIKNDEDFSR